MPQSRIQPEILCIDINWGDYNTRVRVTIEPIAEISNPPNSFLNTARQIKIKGPPDWSTRLDEYLYGDIK